MSKYVEYTPEKITACQIIKLPFAIILGFGFCFACAVGTIVKTIFKK